MKIQYLLIASLIVITSLVSSCSAISSVINKVEIDTSNDIAIVNNIYVGAAFTPSGQGIYVELTPTTQTVANTKYTVHLYEKGNLQQTTSVLWNNPEINVLKEKTVIYNCSYEEAKAYSGEDISNIFTIKVIKPEVTIVETSPCILPLMLS